MPADGERLPAPATPVLPEAKPFWDATARGELLLPRCAECGVVIWYPKAICGACGSLRIDWFRASGRGTVYSYTVRHRGQPRRDTPAYKDAGVYVVAYVELEEGPRLLTNIVECDPESVRIGQPVEAVFHDTGQGTALVRFRPARS